MRATSDTSLILSLPSNSDSVLLGFAEIICCCGTDLNLSCLIGEISFLLLSKEARIVLDFLTLFGFDFFVYVAPFGLPVHLTINVLELRFIAPSNRRLAKSNSISLRFVFT
eukprot:NODE_79_length_23048_cov_0.747614.p18 type:complete len:111 gc:universal NODE_79_length_23048_cov_0.747614:21780-21448(-)